MYLPTTRDWNSWRPIGKWVFVKADPRVKKTSGGIFLPDAITGVERVMEGTGKVLKVGPGVSEVLGIPLNPGERICFRGFLKDAFHEFADEDDCRIFMLRAEDVLAVISEDVQMGEFQDERRATRQSTEGLKAAFDDGYAFSDPRYVGKFPSDEHNG